MPRVCDASFLVAIACGLHGPCCGHVGRTLYAVALQRPAETSKIVLVSDGTRCELKQLLRSTALTTLLKCLTTAAACAVSERSLGVYKVYYWLTATLFVLMFVMAAWFVVLVAVNTTGADPSP